VQAARKRITVTFCSGDKGDEIAHTGTRQVDYEASDPFVTASGGTSLSCPLFAGVTAVADQWNQGSLRFLNPKRYSLAGRAAGNDVSFTGVTDEVVRVNFADGLNVSVGMVPQPKLSTVSGTPSPIGAGPVH